MHYRQRSLTGFACNEEVGKRRSTIFEFVLLIRYEKPFPYELYQLLFNYALQHLATDVGEACWPVVV